MECAASTATRFAPDGSTDAWYSADCCANSSWLGMLTTRAFTPSATSACWALSASSTSDPEATQTFFMDDEIAEAYLLDSILTLADAKHGDSQLDTRQEARRQVGFADQIFISKTDLVASAEVDALVHRLKHMNPRAPQRQVHFGEVPIAEVFDLRGFNLNAKLDIDPEFLNAGEHDHHDHDHGHDHDHEHGEHCDHPHHHHHDDDVKSFVFRAERALNPAKLEDFLGSIVQVYGPKMLR